MNRYRPEITIRKIGRLYFFSGIAVGLGVAIFFIFLFEFIYWQSLIVYIDDLVQVTVTGNEKLPPYYGLFIVTLATASGFCFTTLLWMSRPLPIISKTKRWHQRYARVLPIWFLFSVLAFLLRMSTFFPAQYDTLERDYKFLSFSLPFIIYMICWNGMTRIGRTRKLFWYSTLVVIIVIAILYWAQGYGR